MLQARTYTWESLRSMYAAALEDIQYGQRTWDQPLIDLKEQLLTIEHLTSNMQGWKTTQSGKAGSIKANSSTSDPCRLFNYSSCSRAPCPYAHRCYVCWQYYKEEQDHPGKDCPRRAEHSAKNGAAGSNANPRH